MFQKLIDLIKDIIKYLANKEECDCMKEDVSRYIDDFTSITKHNTLKPIDWVIYYYVDNYSEDFSEYRQSIIFNNMRRYRQNVLSPIRFARTLDEWKAQVKIFFRKNWDEDLPVPFKEKSIAYAFPPYWGEFQWHMYINDDKDFWLLEEDGDYWLLKVLTHEAWHLLNVWHTEDVEDIMYFQYQRDKRIKVTQDTEEWLKNLYAIEINKAKQLLKDN